MMLTDFVLGPYISTLLLAIIVLCLLWLSCNKLSAPGTPPGPSGLEILFGAIYSRKFPAKVLTKWSKVYGPLFTLKFWSTNVVVINTPEIANEAFVKNDCFNDRPQSISTLTGGGLIMINRSSFQKEQRRFALNTLREFGMGRRILEPRVIDVVCEVCESIDKMCKNNGTSQPFDIRVAVYEIPPKIMSCIVFGHDVGKDDKGFRKILRRLMGLEPSGNNKAAVALISAVPFLRKLPYFSSCYKSGQQFQSVLHEAILKEVQEHQKSNNHEIPSDYIDCFLKEMNKFNQLDEKTNADETGNGHTGSNRNEKVGDENHMKSSTDVKSFSSFHEEQLVASVRDLFVAGSETTSTALEWIILFLCKYPDVQKRMQDEIDNILGQSGVPSMSLLDKLPFVWAVIQEVLRMRPIAPLSVPHLASRDAKLQGYHIPKGSIILTNIWGIHQDEEVWSEPERFLPGRHLDEDGKFIKSPHHMIFSVGARSCLGVQLANMELFLTTVLLLQRFCFMLPPGVDPPMEGECGITLKSLPFDVTASRR